MVLGQAPSAHKGKRFLREKRCTFVCRWALLYALCIQMSWGNVGEGWRGNERERLGVVHVVVELRRGWGEIF
ncbi:hypothetical protein GCM10009621_07640 [Corynebacterium felinum]